MFLLPTLTFLTPTCSISSNPKPLTLPAPFHLLAMIGLACPFQMAVLRVLRQLGDVYSSLRIASLGELMPFMPFPEVEAVLVDAVKAGYLQVGDWVVQCGTPMTGRHD
jgi:hypothetical protein